MGTWGITAFEDDTAMDFYDSICEDGIVVPDVEFLADTILEKQYDLELDSYLMDGFDEPLQLLIYAEIICAAKGKMIEQFPSARYHGDAGTPPLKLCKISNKLSKRLITKVISAIKKVQTDQNIHYYTLWEESDNFQKWIEYSDGLIQRLLEIASDLPEKGGNGNLLGKLRKWFGK